jgi:general secretion pathway protein H
MKYRKQSAFTLIEILVVLGIIGLALAIIPPVLSRAIPGTQVKSAVRYLAAGLKTARIHAIATQQESTLSLNVKDFTYSIGDKEKKLHLPDETKMVLVTAESEQTGVKSGVIRFFPDGSSTGGQIKLDYGKSEYVVDVNWLTGKVSVIP